MAGVTWRCLKCNYWFCTLHSVKPVCCPYCKSEEIDTEYNLLCRKLEEKDNKKYFDRSYRTKEE